MQGEHPAVRRVRIRVELEAMQRRLDSYWSVADPVPRQLSDMQVLVSQAKEAHDHGYNELAIERITEARNLAEQLGLSLSPAPIEWSATHRTEAQRFIALVSEQVEAAKRLYPHRQSELAEATALLEEAKARQGLAGSLPFITAAGDVLDDISEDTG